MAKVSFTKLGLTKNSSVDTFNWGDQTIEVKQYLPVSEKMELISNVLNLSQDENNFINEARMSVFMDLEMVFRYTNINFTDKQKEDLGKLYDLLAGNDIFKEIFARIPGTEYEAISVWTHRIAENIYNYNNSAYGILNAIIRDKESLELDAEDIQKKITDPEALKTLKAVLDKLG